jgi:hypothetical protein
MNDRVAELESRVGSLEETVRRLNTALGTETTNRQTAERDLQQQLAGLAVLLTDESDTTGYVIKYVNELNAQYIAKQLILQEAMSDFNDLMKLPPKSNKYIAVWDAAWSGVALVVPGLRLIPALSKLEKAAAIEMTAAKAFMKTPKLVARITTATVKGHNAADVIAKANNLRDKVMKASDVHTRVNVDKTSSAIRYLIDESKVAHQLVDQAIDSLEAEFAARLHGLLFKIPYQTAGSLADEAKAMLPQLGYMDDSELEQLRRFFLWKIISEYARRNVFIVKTTYRTGIGTGIDGLNDSQIEQIEEWFGPQSNWAGGRVPPMLSIWVALQSWGVQTRTESSGGAIFGFG